MSKQGTTLKFDDIHLTVKNSTILHDISGRAEPGELLAVIGPSGSGKTTLLHVISGRHPAYDHGTVTLNDSPLTKTLRRRIALVLQDDIFFANLTLKDTLTFTARLRLPSSMPYKAKVQRVNEIVDILGLGKCLDTKIGDFLHRGISGGERKRASIACELLTDPAILVLDEPTSGLDSTTSLQLVRNLKNFAVNRLKTVVMSIHQPSSQIFHLFDKLMLLAEGQVIYFGRADQALDYFASLGLHCAPNFNPADFLMDKVKGTDEEISILFEAAKRKSWTVIKLTSRGSQTPDWRRSRSKTETPYLESDDAADEIIHINTRHHHSVPASRRHRPLHHSRPNAAPGSTPPVSKVNTPSLLPQVKTQNSSTPRVVLTVPAESSKTPRRQRDLGEVSGTSDGRRERRNTVMAISGIVGTCHNGFMSDMSFSNSIPESYSNSTPAMYGKRLSQMRTSSTRSSTQDSKDSPKWPTTFCEQLLILTQRNFKQSRDIFLSKFIVVKHVLLAILVGLLWFQTSHDEVRLHDIRGIYFFGLVYWGFESMFLVMDAFPSERAIMNKERLSGAYRLSAYYLAKMLSELPLLLIMPTLFFTICYWMAGLNASPWAFLASLCAMVVNVLVGQSIGLAISAYSPSLQEAAVIVTLYMLTTLMLGGFYIEQLPPWLDWTVYLSFTFYFFTLQMYTEFGLNGEPVKCREANSIFEACHLGPNITHVDSVEVLDQIKLLPMSPQAICGTVVGFFIFFRLLGYLILRFVRTPM